MADLIIFNQNIGAAGIHSDTTTRGFIPINYQTINNHIRNTRLN